MSADDAPPVRCTGWMDETEAAQGSEEEEECEDSRPMDDWCRTQGWENCKDCPACGGSGQYDDSTPCSECDGEGIADL